jgi:Tfp pilus assembly protein PilN
MLDYTNKLNSIFVLLEKFGRLLWKYLSFSLADNYFSIAKVVCISIESNGIYLVFGTKIFRKISIKYFKKFPLEEDKALTPEYLAAVVSRVLNEMGAANASFVLSIPRSWTIVQVTEFPITVKENLANVISYELDRLTPLTPENAYYDYKIIGESQDKIKVLLTVAKADRINPFLEALRSKNVKIEKLSISAFVIKKLIQNIYNSKNSIFISVNEKAYECGTIINDFTIRSISGTVKSLDDSQIDQIIRETFPLIDLLTKNGKPAKIIINAEEKYYKIFSEKLAKLPVVNLELDNKLALPKGNKDISSFALGCFLETVTSDQNEFNLLADKNGKNKKTPFITTLALLVVILLIGAFYTLYPIVIEQENIEQIDSRINSLKPEMKKIEALRKEIETISSDIKTINNFKKHSILTMDILKEITAILPDKAWLTRVSVTENSVEIEGYAASATAIIPKLENSKYFEKAEFASPTFRDPRQNNERFVIKMQLKNENKPKKQEEAGVKNDKKK